MSEGLIFAILLAGGTKREGSDVPELIEHHVCSALGAHVRSLQL